MQKAIRFSIKTFCFVVHDKLVRKRRLNRGLFHLGKPIGRLGKQARLFFAKRALLPIGQSELISKTRIARVGDPGWIVCRFL